MRYLISTMVVLIMTFTNASAAYPERPVRILVGVPPGTGIDTMARAVAAKLSEELGQQFIVENRAGAGSNIATEAVARAAPDGYTLLMFNNAQTGNAALNPKLPFDAVRDFAPIAMLGTTPYIFGASPQFPAKNMQELIAMARSKPGAINYASGGHGSPSHLAVELLAAMADVKFKHIPYKGQAAYNPALVTDEVQFAMGTIPGFAALMSSGKIRPFAAGGKTRTREYPNMPTVAESGYPDFDVDIWFALVTTAGTPAPVIRTLNSAIVRILAMPAVKTDLERKGFTVTPSSPEELGKYIVRDVTRWKEVVKRANITPE